MTWLEHRTQVLEELRGRLKPRGKTCTTTRMRVTTRAQIEHKNDRERNQETC